jgi:hypothetical protein
MQVPVFKGIFGYWLKSLILQSTWGCRGIGDMSADKPLTLARP